MSVLELKAQAYDILAQIQAHSAKIEELQKQLFEVNKKVGEELQKQAEVKCE
jgi:hypothetical protein